MNVEPPPNGRRSNGRAKTEKQLFKQLLAPGLARTLRKSDPPEDASHADAHHRHSCNFIVLQGIAES
jgi:hypothetical protein